MDVRRQNVCLVVIFCHLVEGLSGIFLAPGSTAEIFRYSFSLTELFISNQMSQMLRSNFLLGPVITSLEKWFQSWCLAGSFELCK